MFFTFVTLIFVNLEIFVASAIGIGSHSLSSSLLTLYLYFVKAIRKIVVSFPGCVF